MKIVSLLSGREGEWKRQTDIELAGGFGLYCVLVEDMRNCYKERVRDQLELAGYNGGTLRGS
jgi:hypothetical protein